MIEKINDSVYAVSSDNRANVREKCMLYILKNKISEKPNLDKKIGFVCFNNRSRILDIIKLKLKMDFLVWDCGYPYSDNTNVSFFRKIIFFFLDVFILFISDCVIVETYQQKERISRYKKNVYVFYPYNIDLLSAKSNKPEWLREGKYYFFNGNHNRESGLTCIYSFFKKEEIELLIHSRDTNLISLNNVFINKEHVSISELKYLIENSNACIGQCEKGDKRLNFTLPHKFIDAVSLGMIYICFSTKPICEVKEKFGLTGVIFIKSLSELKMIHLEEIETSPNDIFLEENIKCLNSILEKF